MFIHPIALPAYSQQADINATLQMWTKLRPGVHRFLQKAAKAYELWIHTNGASSWEQGPAILLPAVIHAALVNP